jgi:hypothetical protein
MASVKDLLNTYVDIGTGKTTIKNAWETAKATKGGVTEAETVKDPWGSQKDVKGASDDKSSVIYNPNYNPNNKSTSPVQSTKSGGSSKSSSGMSSIDDAEDDQKEAAEKAAEEAREAARRSYNAKEKIAGDAKTSAKGQYDWITETLGSNKQDLLSQVATNTEQGLQNYDMQDKQTRERYDGAKQEILSTYRDLQTQQEKIMRGSGMGQSSRSMEAQLKLNNLMGKDLGSVSKNEADALTLIGTAVANLKQNALNTNTSIERETKTKLDKASLDYNDQITAIDNNLMLGANEKADAYAAAETQLARDTASITSWASGLKLQAEETMAANQGVLDDFIVKATDESSQTASGISTLDGDTNQKLVAAGYTQLAQNSGDINNKAGQYQKAGSKYTTPEEIQNAIANGEISSAEGEQQLASLNSGSNTGVAGMDNPLEDKKTDSLLSAIYA